jgi:phosphoribosyl-ATP pyrophosphohydrolase/phosphoribosyl-AMP cyclohydrolase
VTFAPLKYGADGLITVVVQDRLSGEIRMLAHANDQAVRATLETREAHFYSRSRQALWRKGESSGHVLHVTEVWADCDADALLYLVDPEGPSCHTGRESCFFQTLSLDGHLQEQREAHGRALLPRLFMELQNRQRASADQSYTRRLLDAGFAKIGAKIREEAEELAQAIDHESNERVVAEAADELYHLLVGLLSRGLSLRDVEAELARRFGVSGLLEKASRTTKNSDTGSAD